MNGVERVVRRETTAADAARASRTWWDDEAAGYQQTHGSFLGDADFVWCPERLREADAHLLGAVSGQRGLEVGCGAAQCGRWLVRQGASMVSLDLSWGQLSEAVRLSTTTGTSVPLVQGDACALPFLSESFDFACSAFGAIPFVASPLAVMTEVARVLRPGGRFVFSVTHPIRWCFPDDPGPDGLVATASYFDRRPYVEQDDSGEVTYVETHRTIGDRVRELVAAGFVVTDIIEPEWPADHSRPWEQWSPLRGRIIPGTAIFVAHLPD